MFFDRFLGKTVTIYHSNMAKISVFAHLVSVSCAAEIEIAISVSTQGTAVMKSMYLISFLFAVGKNLTVMDGFVC